MNRFRMWMGLSTCAGLLTCIVGCPSPQPAKPAAPPPAPAVFSRSEMESLRVEYHHKLHPHHSPEVIDGPNRELLLVGFHRETPDAIEIMRHLKGELRRRVVDRKARIVWEEPGGEWSFRFRYESDRGVHGSVHCQLTPHNGERNNWDLVLRVNEERR